MPERKAFTKESVDVKGNSPFPQGFSIGEDGSNDLTIVVSLQFVLSTMNMNNYSNNSC